jgi:hypothetical protein
MLVSTLEAAAVQSLQDHMMYYITLLCCHAPRLRNTTGRCVATAESYEDSVKLTPMESTAFVAMTM